MMTVCIVIDAMIRKHMSELCYVWLIDFVRYYDILLLDMFDGIV